MNLTDILVGFFLLVGIFFTFVGSLGLLRLPDLFMRLHAPTKATTLGLGGFLMASLIFFTAERGSPSAHEILVTLFLFITAPISAHLMAKAAIHVKLPRVERTRGKPWES
jgi:multicomponent K+:H+ antiporter subunit G